VHAVIAAAVAIAAAAIWLCFLDRLGVILVGGNAWCGAKALLLLFSCHAAVAAPVVVVFVAFRALTAVVPRGRRIVIPIVGAVTGFVALWVLFVELPLNNVIPWSVALATPFVGALGAGFATTLRTTPRNKRLQIGFAAALSIFAGVVDATFFPTLVVATHIRAYAVTVVASVVGIGLPAGALLSQRRERWVPAAVLGVTVAAASGIWISATAARGLVAAVSPPIGRLLALLPGTAPAGVLRLTLSSPNLPDTERAPPAAPAAPPLAAPKSVILITVDALRADALRPAPGRGSYMLPGDTPFVDQWMMGATWFDSAVSQGSSTVDAMRSLMRGINSGDEHHAADIPAMAERLGLRSAAVVPAFIRIDGLFQTGIERFDRAEFYDQRRQEQQVDLIEQVIADMQGDRFFLWTHFICTHQPYYSLSGPRELQFFIPPTDVGRLAAEYREAVRWLDGQLARLLRALEQKGLRSSTLLVLTADHGEHIGDGLLIGHGDALHESDIRVPLLFDVPGQAGATVKTLVGSRDVLPTIVEILGGAPEPSHRGESLTPLMRERAPQAARIYPIRGVLRTAYGLLTERDLLVYTPGLAAFQRFPRPPGVTSGSGDAFGLDRASDEARMVLLAGFEPAAFAEELKDASTSRLLADRIFALSGKEATSWVDALLRLAQQTKTAEVQVALRRAFSVAPNIDAKLRILAGAFAGDEAYWSVVLAQLLSGARGSPTEASLVDAVERLGLAGKVAPALAIFRLAEVRSQSATELGAVWLSLLGASPRGGELVPYLTTLSETVDANSAASREVLLLLRAVAALTVPAASRPKAARLAAWVRPLTGDSRERVASAACAALGAVGSSDDVELAKGLVESPKRTEVRRAALRASVRLQGSAAIDSLKIWAQNPVLAPTALGQIVLVGDRAALEWAQRELGAQSDAFKRELLQQTIVDLQKKLQAPAR